MRWKVTSWNTTIRWRKLNSARADLEELAKASNPTINYYDPLSLAEADLWGEDEDATIIFLPLYPKPPTK